MKRKIMFLLPRIAGVTIIVGVAALLLGIVFKLLLVVTLLGLLAAGVAVIAGALRKQHGGNRTVGLPTHNKYDESSMWERNSNAYASVQKTIVPVN